MEPGSSGLELVPGAHLVSDTTRVNEDGPGQRVDVQHEAEV